MAVLQQIFSDSLNPENINLSNRFTQKSAFFITVPLNDFEIQIDVFLQIYIPIGENVFVRNIPLGKIEEQSVLLNITDTETSQFIPIEYLDTGLEMALLFLPSDAVYLEAFAIGKNVSLTNIDRNLENLRNELSGVNDEVLLKINGLEVAIALLLQKFDDLSVCLNCDV